MITCGDDKRKAKGGTIGLVQRLEPIEFRLAEAVEAEALLFVGGRGAQRAGPGQLASEIGVLVD